MKHSNGGRVRQSSRYVGQRLNQASVPGLEPFPGAIALARVRHPAGDAGGEPHKQRPVILIAQKGTGSEAAWWYAWGLTGNPTLRDGRPRVPAPDLPLVGMARGYLWGGPRIKFPPADVVGVIWAAPPNLILACATAESGELAGNPNAITRDLHLAHLDAGWYWPKPDRGAS